MREAIPSPSAVRCERHVAPADLPRERKTVATSGPDRIGLGSVGYSMTSSRPCRIGGTNADTHADVAMATVAPLGFGQRSQVSATPSRIIVPSMADSFVANMP
jgi:hypothetical protein